VEGGAGKESPARATWVASPARREARAEWRRRGKEAEYEVSFQRRAWRAST